MNNKKDWNNSYEEILKLFNNTEINIDANKEHNMIIKFTAKSIDWNDIKNMLIDVIIKNAAVDPMDKLKKEYMFDREQNKSLNIMSSKTYLESMVEYRLRNNPKEYYGSIWINWYDYLGLDIEGYPKTIENWREIVKNRRIKGMRQYMTYIDLPTSPNDLYDKFENFECELNKIWDKQQRRC